MSEQIVAYAGDRIVCVDSRGNCLTKPPRIEGAHACDKDACIKELKEELAIAEASARLHAGLNRRAAKALGKPREGTGSSWHDIPECITALCSRVEELEEENERLLIRLEDLQGEGGEGGNRG